MINKTSHKRPITRLEKSRIFLVWTVALISMLGCTNSPLAVSGNSLQNGITFPGGTLPVNGSAGAAVQLQAGTLVGTVATPVGNPYVATPGTPMGVQWASVSTTQCAIYANSQALVPPGGGASTMNGSISLGVISTATQVVAICSAANGTTTAAQISIEVGAGNAVTLTVDNVPALNATVPVSVTSTHTIAWTAPGAASCQLQTASGSPLQPTSLNSYTVQEFAPSQGYVLACSGYSGGGSVVGGVYLIETSSAIGAAPTVNLSASFSDPNGAPVTLTNGQSGTAAYGTGITVTWSQNNAAFCTLQATGVIPPVLAGQQSPFPTTALGAESFTVNCTATDGAVTPPQTVLVTVPPGTPIGYVEKNNGGSTPAETLYAIDSAGITIRIGGNQNSSNSHNSTIGFHFPPTEVLRLQVFKDISSTDGAPKNLIRDTNNSGDIQWMYFCLDSTDAAAGTVTYIGEINDNEDTTDPGNTTDFADSYFYLTLPSGVTIQNITPKSQCN